MMHLHKLESSLEYHFKQVSLLEQALTHRSYSAHNYERLEFVGDVILDLAISIQLYKRHPKLPEGDLSKIRAGLVNQATLVSIATKLKLGDYLYLGEGEIKSGGKDRPSILADTLEAIIAAVSFDTNLQEANNLVERLYKEQLASCTNLIINKDSKTLLQEYLQARKIPVPNYTIVDTKGPQHDNIFLVECVIPELNIHTSAYGKNKKEASQAVAEQILANLIKGKK